MVEEKERASVCVCGTKLRQIQVEDAWVMTAPCDFCVAQARSEAYRLGVEDERRRDKE